MSTNKKLTPLPPPPPCCLPQLFDAAPNDLKGLLFHGGPFSTQQNQAENGDPLRQVPISERRQAPVEGSPAARQATPDPNPAKPLEARKSAPRGKFAVVARPS